MKLLADLHIHTTASDGTLSPEEVVRWAKRKNLKAIAITDHDTISGIEPATIEGNKLDIEVIPGIELNSVYNDEDIHILGYFIDYKNTKFIELLTTIQQDRISRAQKMVENLKNFGLNITYDEVLKEAQGESVGRPHIARVLQSKGYIMDIKEAFDRYIGRGGPGYVERFKISPDLACNYITMAGGIPILAHPGLIKNKEIITKLVREKHIKGIEVYHSLHTKNHNKEFRNLALLNDLRITGGSDCHGRLLTNNMPMLGDFTVPYQEVQGLKQLLDLI